MSHEVIMPALGMAQDTGLLVVWHKAVGDKVSVGDILMEVETDKSTMEVEAAANGYVTELRADEGSEIPVGQVIAIISETADAQPQTTQKPEPIKKVEPALPEPVIPVTEPNPTAKSSELKPPASSVGDRILVTPKARRLAAEQGLDLSKLVAAGVPQPYRIADLDTLKTIPASNVAAQSATSHITARVSTAAFTRFSEWLSDEVEELAPASAMWAAFAAAGLRSASNSEHLTIRITHPASGTITDFRDPDKKRLSTLQIEENSEPDLVLHDLTGSRIVNVQYAGQECPSLNVVQEGDIYELTLTFLEARLSVQDAFALLESFAERMEEPLRHLL